VEERGSSFLPGEHPDGDICSLLDAVYGELTVDHDIMLNEVVNFSSF